MIEDKESKKDKIRYGLWCIFRESVRRSLLDDNASGDEYLARAKAAHVVADCTSAMMDLGNLTQNEYNELDSGLALVFDVLKPWPISWCDKKLPGAWGVMIDDVVAGIFAAICLWGVRTYVHIG